MTFLSFLIARSRLLLIAAVALGVLSGAANAGMLAVINTEIAAGRLAQGLVLGLFAALWLIAPLFRVLSEVLLTRLGQDAAYSLRTELVGQILHLPYRNLEAAGLNRILPALTEDIPNITNTIAAVPLLCINLGVVLSCFAYMVVLSSSTFCLVIACVIFGAITYQFGVSRASRHFEAARRSEGSLNRRFQALVAGIKELKIDARKRAAFQAGLAEEAQGCRAANQQGLGIYSAASSWGQLLVFTTIAGVLVFLTHAGGSRASVMIGFPVAVLYLMTPLQVIMNALPGYMKASVAVKHVKELGISLRVSEPATLPQLSPGVLAGPLSIELKNVCFSYGDPSETRGFLLGPISALVPAGQVVFIAGGNGSGKTTLAKLLLGLYVPSSGQIKANGCAIGKSEIAAYQGCFSVVFSDFYLSGSLDGTTRFDRDSVAAELLEEFELTDRVSVQDGSFSNTSVSQGQRKRLALLACFLEDRPAVLLDEWAADQDPEFKAFFYRTLLPRLREKGKTVLVITHDERHFDVADQLWFMEDGTLKRIETQTQFSSTLTNTQSGSGMRASGLA